MITLTSSVNSGDVLQLPNPKLGDTHTLNFKRVNRTTRGNDLILEGEANWLPTKMHRYDWDYLTERQVDLLYDFLKRHIGIPFFVVTMYGENWKVIHLKPEAEFSQVGVDNRTVSLDMNEVQA